MIIITGASGYIGSHIAKQLVASGKMVRALVNNRERAEREGRLVGLDIPIIEADIRKVDSLQRAFQGATAVIHTVAMAIEKGGRTYEEINYHGTLNALKAAKSNGITRFINLSQLGADPDVPYRFLASKGKAQYAVATSGLEWTALRPSVVWGPEDEFANTFAKLIPLTPLIFPIVGDKNSLFQPVWVGDVAICIDRALDDPETIGQEYELGGPEILTLEEIERRTLNAVGARRFMIPFPRSVLQLIVGLLETLLPAPPVTRSLLELLAVSNVTTNNRITHFVAQPKPFTVENITPYMRQFRVKDTLAQFLGR